MDGMIGIGAACCQMANGKSNQGLYSVERVEKKKALTPLEAQSRFGGKPVNF